MGGRTKLTKTEQRVLRALYHLQREGLLELGVLATYDRLLAETMCSRAALLNACQRLVRHGKLIRCKVNAADRARWKHSWPPGFARRQTHFHLPPAMLETIEAEGFEASPNDDVLGKGPLDIVDCEHGGYPMFDE
jgi:hypothetical protein